MRISLFTPILLTLVLFLESCKSGGSGSNSDDFAGGEKVVRIAEVIIPVSIFPHRITNVVEGLIASQIHEGLVRINPVDLSIVPGLAEKWEINPDGKTITFHLRKGLKFQNKDGVEGNITSKDVKFTFELLCTDRPGNVQFETVCKDRIVGANEYFQANIKGQKTQLKGLKIIDELTFSIELLNSPNIFLEILANPVASIISEQGYKLKKEDTKVGAGPFVLDEKSSTKTHFALYKNVNYYGKDKAGKSLPYIDSVIIDIVSSTEVALQRFQHGNIDFIGSVPSNQLRQVVEENIKSFKGNPALFILDQRPEMGTSYYVFNVNHPPFNNIKLRQAINYGIDRAKIIDRVLNGQAYGPAINGIVPPTFDFYKSYSIKGYDLDIEKAKKLLAEAGYPNGKGLAEIQLIVNSGNSRNNTVAGEIQKQLKNNLNINITFESLPNPEKFALQLKGKGDIFRDGWVADYPSPESFLSIFYGEPVTNDTTRMSYPNTIKYKNSEYDKYYKKGRDALNRDTAAIYFLKAEQILMNDAPLIPLWYESNCRLIKTRLKNFHVNPIRYFDFTQVIIEDKKVEEKK
ncbi:ABC transporter substrate-binding protein [Sediminibacterium sp.]|uniref:ABC transporter substrate-binding protein n=1 Tax=Sediminibacterium sp. TaxID=1917865 RepID=UPI002736C307|nr:ABC transporter substrate-binding protein [Sediminibacterium sp.]MDP3567636.1 ABC transporter substrate-binding protein [Sediminibacterium sp.]